MATHRLNCRRATSIRLALSIGAIAILLPPSAGFSQTPDPVSLRWDLTPGVPIRYMMLDSTRPEASGSEHEGAGMRFRMLTTFELTPRACAPMDPEAASVACDSIPMTIQRQEFALSLDSGRTFTAPQDLARHDTTIVRLLANGSWEPLAHGTPTSAGFGVEMLSAATPLTLPSGPVQIGEEWPVETFLFRDNRMHGRIEIHFRGSARVDSVIGTRAWLSVSGTGAASMGGRPSTSESRSIIEWDLSAGRMVSAQTDEVSDFSPVPEARPPVRGTRMHTWTEVRRLEPDSAHTVPVP